MKLLILSPLALALGEPTPGEKCFVPWTRAASHTHIQHILFSVQSQVLLVLNPLRDSLEGAPVFKYLAGTSSPPVFCTLNSHCPSHTRLRSSSSPAGRFHLKSHRDTRHTSDTCGYSKTVDRVFLLVPYSGCPRHQAWLPL